MSPQQDLMITILALALCAAIAVLGFKRNFAEHNELKPRMVPWMVISLGAIATGFMLIVHLVNLMGLETGRF